MVTSYLYIIGITSLVILFFEAKSIKQKKIEKNSITEVRKANLYQEEKNLRKKEIEIENILKTEKIYKEYIKMKKSTKNKKEVKKLVNKPHIYYKKNDMREKILKKYS